MAWPMPEGAVLGIFAKRPDPGSVKTRLAAEFGDEFAAEAAGAMVLDLADLWGSERILEAGGRRVLVFAPDDAGPWFDERIPAGLALQPQVEGDLGDRMKAFFDGEFGDGASRVVLIGSDSPTLDPSIVISAFLTLESRDVVLGPSADGGYYLVGCRPPTPPIFSGPSWGTPGVLEETIHALKDSGLALGVLPPWYDVDTPDDIRSLRGHLRAMRRAGIDPICPRLETFLGLRG